MSRFPRRAHLALAAGLGALLGCTSPPAPAQPPRLVVVVVVDQMRADLLERLEDRFDGGLARVARDGRRFTRAHHEHNVTWTAAGHATLATGAHPARHGIVGNYWWDRARRAAVRAVQAPDGRRSASNLRTSTVGGWLKARDSASRVWSVSLKDRSALLSAGPDADGAFRYDRSDGRFVLCSGARPAWADAFDDRRDAEPREARWELLLPAESYAAPDDFARGEAAPNRFPHELPSGDDWFNASRWTPFSDRRTLDFARALVEGEQLGADGVPDLLWLALSGTDYVGHAYGPFSREIEDHFLRLDRMLGEFFSFLDGRVGPQRWLLVLTSDHGVLPLPERSRALGKDARRVDREELTRFADRALRETLRELGVPEGAVRLVWAEGFVFDFAPESLDDETLRALRTGVRRRLLEHPRVEDVFTADELASPDPLGRPFERRFRNGFFPGRSADLQLRLRELDLAASATVRTNHGSPYDHDTHVPLLFLGPGVPPGVEDARVATTDVAPTLAACLGLPTPATIDGRPLASICRRR